MNSEPLIYCFSFGTLVAGVVTAVFMPFCRKRTPLAARAPNELFAASEKNRISSAMRQWAAVRADSDLEYVPPPPEPPPPPPAVRKEAPATPPPSAPVRDEPATAADAETSVAEANPFLDLDFQGAPNFYEILQISPRADLDTIHRVYRIMAARFHPDNPVSGDHERFIELQQAYDVLSEPERRAQYDVALRARETRPLPIFETRIFVDGLHGEVNRRFGVLALLYRRRRLNQGSTGVSMLALEQQMSLPREHLEFTLWYLRAKGYVQVLEDNSDFAITAPGVDYVESNSSKNPIVREVLAAAAPAQAAKPAPAPVVKKKSRRTAKADNRRGRGDTARAIMAA